MASGQRGQKVIITADPKGLFLEGLVSGTPKPGTLMEPSAFFTSGGRHTYRVYQPGTDGYKQAVIVLLEDDLQGKLITDAYVDGTRGRFYCPVMGEELNMLFGDVAGTADDWTAGAYATADSGTGKLVAAAGSDADHMKPFQILVSVVDPAADFLAPCMYTGH